MQGAASSKETTETKIKFYQYWTNLQQSVILAHRPNQLLKNMHIQSVTRKLILAGLRSMIY